MVISKNPWVYAFIDLPFSLIVAPILLVKCGVDYAYYYLIIWLIVSLVIFGVFISNHVSMSMNDVKPYLFICVLFFHLLAYGAVYLVYDYISAKVGNRDIVSFEEAIKDPQGYFTKYGLKRVEGVNSTCGFVNFKIVDNSGVDTFAVNHCIVYSNINPKFFDGWHVCPDSISTPENFAKIEEGGYGYIFRGKIYSKEETEKYWNIIEQYKLREAGK